MKALRLSCEDLGQFLMPGTLDIGMEGQDQHQDVTRRILDGDFSSDELAILKKLDLSGLELRSLPEELFGPHFKSLESIDLSGNKLTWVTGSFESEKTVKSMDLSHNYLFTLPRWLSTKLVLLQKLNLSDNFFNDCSIECFDLAFLWLQSLYHLDARNCRFQTIPVVFCRLRQLKRLFIGNKDRSKNRWNRNCLPVVPSYLANLQSLTELTVANAFVQNLPENLGDLRNLRRLDISGNEIAFLPNSIVRLRSLEVLKASNNKLSYPVSRMNKMSKLRSVDLSHNVIACLFHDWNLIKSLRVLDLYDNRLAQDSLDDFVPLLTNLESLDVGGNRNLSLASIGRLIDVDDYLRLESRLRADVDEERASPGERDVVDDTRPLNFYSDWKRNDADIGFYGDDGADDFSDEEPDEPVAPQSDESGSSGFVTLHEVSIGSDDDSDEDLRPFKPVPFPPKKIQGRDTFPIVVDGQFDDAEESCDQNTVGRELPPPAMLSKPTPIDRWSWRDLTVTGQFSDAEEDR